MTGLFEVIASTDDPAGPRAVIAAQTRAKAVFERYVGNDVAKLAFIADDLRKMATEVADEYGHDNVDELYGAAIVALAGGHPADCTCGFCKNKGNLPGMSKDDEEAEEDMDKESSVKTACSEDCEEDHDHDRDEDEDERKNASVTPRPVQEFDWERVAGGVEDRSGDSYQHERVELPSSETGLGSEGSPKIDKAKSGDQTGWNLEPIDVGSKRHQLEHQDATDAAEYNNADFDPSNPVRERIDADSPLQPEHNVADNTKTWSDVGTQAQPVTSKWKLLG